MTSYFFCGIGGSGMSPLAQVMAKMGHTVKGSDRSYDQGNTTEKFESLKDLGIRIHAQDGSGLTAEDILVVSSAVEDTIPDVKRAKELNIPILKRAELLSELFNDMDTNIAIGGTSGKSTVTAMVGHILNVCGKQPNVINGAVMKNSNDGLGNVILHKNSDCMVIEADESDGSIALYQPAISVLLNISEDHKSFDELYDLFGDFISKPILGSVLNLDCGHSTKIAGRARNPLSFSLCDDTADFYASNITPTATGVTFLMNDISVTLKVPGKHNVANALAAIAAAVHAGIDTKEAALALTSFTGVKRRLDVLGTQSSITVIDDFGHNPDKIEAGLTTLQEHEGRLLVMFQPHGFGPTKMMKEGYIQSFVEGLKDEDILLIPEIFYAGGTVERSISSKDLIDAIARQGKQAKFFDTRDDVASFIRKEATAGDRIVIMGARDDTLTTFGLSLLKSF